VPPRYGSGAEQIVASIHKNPLSKSAWITELLGAGDIDRVIIEWRSLLRQISKAPPLDWARWTALQAMAKGILHETESPTLTDLPHSITPRRSASSTGWCFDGTDRRDSIVLVPSKRTLEKEVQCWKHPPH
jgi:hypothetical protein